MSNQEEQVIRKIERREHIRLSETRIPPLDEKENAKFMKDFLLNKSEWDKMIKTYIENTKEFNKQFPYLHVFATYARYRELRMRLGIFTSHILGHSLLPARENEILTLRIARLCYSKYAWGQHALNAKATGLLSDDDISRIIEGPDAEGWDPFDAILLRAVDELYTDAFITNETWKILTERYDTSQLMDLVITVGFYNMTAMALNTFGVQLEEKFKALIKGLGIKMTF